MNKFLLFAMVLITFSCSANKSKVLEVEGKFLTEKFASYEVFQGDASGNFIEVACEQHKKEFRVSLEINKIYKIKFISKSGIEKELIIEVTKEGSFKVDVDFSTDNSAKLIYDLGDDRYEVRKLHKNELYVKK